MSHHCKRDPVQHNDLLTINFVITYFTQWDYLVFDTSLVTRGPEYEPYFLAFKQELGHHIKDIRMGGETHWSKFLIYSISLDTIMDDITTFIHTNFPRLWLTQTPRWPVTEYAKRTKNKHVLFMTAFTIVVVLLGSHSLKSLGVTSLSVCNLWFCLVVYRSYNVSTLDCRCRQLGHSTGWYSNLISCGHCRTNNLSRNHSYRADRCNGGARCTKPPVKSVNSNNALNPSIDRTCLARVGAMDHAKWLDVLIVTKEPSAYGPQSTQYRRGNGQKEYDGRLYDPGKPSAVFSFPEGVKV